MTIPTDTSALPQQIRIVGRWRFLMLFLTTSALVSIYAVAAVADDSLPSNPLPAGHEPYTPTIADPILDARNWTRYPELSGYGLGCLTQATDGAMWFGLEDEVRRYDGLSWTSYTEADGMAGDDTQALLGARDGSVWVGSKTGISRFADGRWTRVLPPAGEIPWTTWSLTERDGEIWAGTDLGLLHLAADGPVLYTGVVSEALRDLFSYLDIRSFADELRPSKGWDTEGAQTLYDYSVEPYWSEATVVDVAAHSPAAAADVRVGDRVVWRKGTEGVRRVIRRGQDTIMVVDPPGAPAVGEASLIQVSDVLPWPDGGLWVGLYPDHLLRFYPDRVDSGGVLLQSLNSGNKGRKLARTRNGTIWFTSGWGAPLQYVDSQGVAVVDTARWSRYVNNSLSILTAADGSLWIGESAGLR
ncbi:MAG: hypothetical protein HOH74_09890, partial [Gemmatimonadetes bacterium]|nr:hypothetical protein [Gemmatimonadota bacterium]